MPDEPNVTHSVRQVKRFSRIKSVEFSLFCDYSGHGAGTVPGGSSISRINTRVAYVGASGLPVCGLTPLTYTWTCRSWRPSSLAASCWRRPWRIIHNSNEVLAVLSFSACFVRLVLIPWNIRRIKRIGQEKLRCALEMQQSSSRYNAMGYKPC